MNFNTGKRPIDLSQERQSSPIRDRGYVSQNFPSSPPQPQKHARLNHSSGDYLFNVNDIQSGRKARLNLAPLVEENTEEFDCESDESNGSHILLQVEATAVLNFIKNVEDSDLSEPPSFVETPSRSPSAEPESLATTNLPQPSVIFAAVSKLVEEFDPKKCRRSNGNYRKVMAEINKRGYSLEAFITDVVHFKDEEHKSNRTRLLKALAHPKTRAVLNDNISNPHSIMILSKKDKSFHQTASFIVHKELKSLKGMKPFVDWNVSTMQDTFEELDITEVAVLIQNQCPFWHTLLTSLLKNWRHTRTKYNKDNLKQLQRGMYMITSMIMYRMSARTAHFPLLRLSLYLRAMGVKDRVIDVLSRYGICPVAKTVREKEQLLGKLAKVRATHLSYLVLEAKSPQVVYTNME